MVASAGLGPGQAPGAPRNLVDGAWLPPNRADPEHSQCGLISPVPASERAKLGRWGRQAHRRSSP
eukprot:8177365-Alexandrium_andersonii.AAC.1